MTKANTGRGFTLLEVLVAVAILALAMTALVRASGQQAEVLVHARDLTLATWVASDVLTEVHLRERFPAIGTRDGSVEQGGRQWRWELAVSATDQPSVRRLEVTVYEAQATSEDAPVARMTGFAGQP